MAKPIPVLIVLLTSLANASAHATTTTASFDVHVKIVASCTTSATPLDFGTLPGLILGTETTSATLTVNCTKGAAYTLQLDQGSGAMTGQTITIDKVNYNVTLTANAAIGTGLTQIFAISGALPAQTTPSAQDYQEQRNVTITY